MGELDFLLILSQDIVFHCLKENFKNLHKIGESG